VKSFKLIVSDLDGTLLNNHKEISAETKRTLQKCRDAGILIAYATARPVRGVEFVTNSFKPDYLINHNGAVYSFKDKQTYFGMELYHIKEFAKRLLEKFPEVEIAVESNDVIYSNFDVTKYWYNEPHTRLTNFPDDLPIECAEKMIIGLEFVDIETVRKMLPDAFHMQIADGIIGMIMSTKATKLNAIASLCDELEISIEEVVAFGDDHNDLEMISGVGMGVAMGNAIDEIKKVAKTVTLTNEENGLAYWLKENILK